MNIYITLDYELFFGETSGSVDNCIIKPTQDLLNILEPYNIKMTCFVDSGYLIALQKQKDLFPQLEKDYKKVTQQIKYLADNKHGIELHIHPHWEDSYYDGEKWIFDMSRYKLADFNEDEVKDIVTRYTDVLKKISCKSPVAYRAGGWSAQPFLNIEKALKSNNILIDSTVFAKGIFKSKNQAFNFKNVPLYKSEYNFSDDLTKENSEGDFLEIPISSQKMRPMFFWRFALKKILKQKKDQSYGDGNAAKSSKVELLKMLLFSSYSVVSIDGYKSSMILKAYKKYNKKTNTNGNFVLIGHPKAFTPYSLKKTSEFIAKVHKSNTFVTYRQ